MTLTDEQLAAIEARNDRSMPLSLSGVRSRFGGEPVLTLYGPDDKTYVFVLYGTGSVDDHDPAYATANSIENSRTDIRALLDEVGRLRASISPCDICGAADHNLRANRLEGEVTALRHDITRHMEIANERLAEIEKLRSGMIRAGLHKEAPCRICGYNGPGFYQPDTHSCVALAASHD